MPHSGVYIVQGEVALVLASMKKNSRWSHRQDDDQDPLVAGFTRLKEILTGVTDLSQLDPNVYLTPFLDVVRSEDTTGPVTGVALSSLHKFLSYGTIDPGQSSSAAAIENLADAVTHARFVGTDPASDEVVLMKILQVLRTLLLTTVGVHMTNESVCEIMQSCFRICFEPRLSDLLRRSAEQTLMDMVQLLFLRLPSFTEDSRIASQVSPGVLHRETKAAQSNEVQLAESTTGTDSASQQASEATVESESLPVKTAVLGSQETPSIVEDQRESPSPDVDAGADSGCASPRASSTTLSDLDARELSAAVATQDGESDVEREEYVNEQGVRFTQRDVKSVESLTPYGLPCIQELFHFLISLCNPADKHNTESMIHTGLSLLTVALECGAVSIVHFPSLASHVQDALTRNLFALLKSPLLSLFSAALRVLFLLFATMRSMLKFQLEMFLGNLEDLIASESQQITHLHERKEVALDCLAQLCRVPGFAAELYLNYDCQPYNSDVLEELTKVLSKHAFPVSGLYSTHRLCVDALLAIIQAIEYNCRSANGKLQSAEKNLPVNHRLHELQQEQQPAFGLGLRRWSSDPRLSSNVTALLNSSPPRYFSPAAQGPATSAKEFAGSLQEHNECSSSAKPSEEDARRSCSASTLFGIDMSELLSASGMLIEVKQKKKLLLAGTELFNAKPKKGIAFLQEHGIFPNPVDPDKLAGFLHGNPRLDKKMIGEFIGDRKNTDVLKRFIRLFNFRQRSMDQGLRQFLESFRLPGEAPVILHLLEEFSGVWMEMNPEQSSSVADAESASVLAYAIIMLNTDQHNPKSVQPMTFLEFKKNQRNTNGGKDFPEEMLREIYDNIRDNEIVMPAEQTGEVLKNYLWRMLLLRSASSEGQFLAVAGGQLDQDVFHLVWGQVVAALSYMFDNSLSQAIVRKAIAGFRKCAAVAAHYNLSDVFDNLIITLCKFTLLLVAPEGGESLASSFGRDVKAQIATRTLFSLAHKYGDILREGWKNTIDCIVQLYRARLLPETLVKVEDFADPTGFVLLVKEEQASQKQWSLLNFFLASDSGTSQRGSPDDVAAQKRAVKCIQECRVEQLVTDSKFLRRESLQELVKALTFGSHGADAHQSLGTQFDEESAVFNLEFLVAVAIKNRDRMDLVWSKCGIADHLAQLIHSSPQPCLLLERAVVGVLRVAIRMLRREMVESAVSALKFLHDLHPSVWPSLRRQVSCALQELLRSSSSCSFCKDDWCVVLSLVIAAGSGSVLALHQPEQTASFPDMVTADGAVGLEQWTDLRIPPEAHDFDSLARACESLAYLVRGGKQLTADNFTLCVHAARTFGQVSSSQDDVTAPVRGDRAAGSSRSHHYNSPAGSRGRAGEPSNFSTRRNHSERRADTNHGSVAIQTLDLMHALHGHAKSVIGINVEQASTVSSDSVGMRPVWLQCWCPLLSGIASLCCDQRIDVRQTAFTYLQKTLLRHDVDQLSAAEWESCFNKVLFPMIQQLLTNIDPAQIEEMRKRASALTCKVFLQHLVSLSPLPTFRDLWLSMLNFLEQFMTIGSNDLEEHIHESLKNMLLVMSTAGVCEGSPMTSGPLSPIWESARAKIYSFAPNLWEEVFGPTPAPNPPLSAAISHVPAGDVHARASPIVSPSRSPVTIPEVASTTVPAHSDHQSPLTLPVRSSVHPSSANSSPSNSSPAVSPVITAQPGMALTSGLTVHPGLAQPLPGIPGGVQLAPAAPAAPALAPPLSTQVSSPPTADRHVPRAQSAIFTV